MNPSRSSGVPHHELLWPAAYSCSSSQTIPPALALHFRRKYRHVTGLHVLGIVGLEPGLFKRRTSLGELVCLGALPLAPSRAPKFRFAATRDPTLDSAHPGFANGQGFMLWRMKTYGNGIKKRISADEADLSGGLPNVTASRQK